VTGVLEYPTFPTCAPVRMRAGLLELRDALPSDSEAFVEYWHSSGEQHLNFLGIDRAKLGTREETQLRFLRMVRVPGLDQSSVVITLVLNGRVVGYTNINMYGPYDNYIHFHTYRSSVRSSMTAYRGVERRTGGASVAPVAIGLILSTFFALFPVQRLILQTRTRNLGINRALDHYMPVVETHWLENPNGLAEPGEFHIRYVYRDRAGLLVQRARQLAEGN